MRYPKIAPDGKPWTLSKAIAEYGVPVPLAIREMCNIRTIEQVQRERDELRIQSARNWAASRRAAENGYR